MTTKQETWAVPPEVVESLAALAALPPLPTIHQVAVALQMSDPSVRRFIADSSLKAFRVGKRTIRIDKASVIKFASQPVNKD